MTTLSIQKKTVMIVFAILTALYESIAMLGCGLGGVPYES